MATLQITPSIWASDCKYEGVSISSCGCLLIIHSVCSGWVENLLVFNSRRVSRQYGITQSRRNMEVLTGKPTQMSDLGYNLTRSSFNFK